jgi:hypothetical protein
MHLKNMSQNEREKYVSCVIDRQASLACAFRKRMAEGQLLYHFDQVFSHASRPKKSLTQNVFLLIYLIFLVFFLTIFFQMCEHLVEMVQYTIFRMNIEKNSTTT